MKHIIVLGSSFKTGKRIALDFCSDNDKYKKFIEKINCINKSGSKKIMIATHLLTTETGKWDEIVKMDHFFKNIDVIKDENEFIKLILDDNNITALDVADYLLTKAECSHTRLHKILYFMYADYLCLYNKKLFDGTIYAFNYGPVIYEVYKKYSSLKDEEKKNYIVDDREIKLISKKYKNPVEVRILIANLGVEKINLINEELKKYKNIKTEDLVNLTHKKNTPWSKNYDKGSLFNKIPDSDIRKLHKNEVIN